MTSEITYDILMKGMDAHQTRVDNKMKYYKGLKQGEFKIIGKYGNVQEARKVRNNFKAYQTQKKLVNNYSVKLISNEDIKSKSEQYVVAVVCLTDEDKKKKKEEIKILEKRFRRN